MGILWLLPLPPAQNWLYRNALIAAEQKDALCLPLPHGCALIVYGTGIKTASVSSAAVAEHSGRGLLCARGSACDAGTCKRLQVLCI